MVLTGQHGEATDKAVEGALVRIVKNGTDGDLLRDDFRRYDLKIFGREFQVEFEKFRNGFVDVQRTNDESVRPQRGVDLEQTVGLCQRSAMEAVAMVKPVRRI